MCPGLTSPGAVMAEAEAGDVVVRTPVTSGVRAVASPLDRRGAGNLRRGQAARDGGRHHENVLGPNVRCPSAPSRCARTPLVTGRAACGRSREVNKGVGVETVHVLNDNLWKLGDFV